MRACMHACVHACMRACMRARVRACVRACVRVQALMLKGSGETISNSLFLSLEVSLSLTPSRFLPASLLLFLSHTLTHIRLDGNSALANLSYLRGYMEIWWLCAAWLSLGGSAGGRNYVGSYLARNVALVWMISNLLLVCIHKLSRPHKYKMRLSLAIALDCMNTRTQACPHTLAHTQITTIYLYILTYICVCVFPTFARQFYSHVCMCLMCLCVFARARVFACMFFL